MSDKIKCNCGNEFAADPEYHEGGCPVVLSWILHHIEKDNERLSRGVAAYDAYVADLRNKYGRVNNYFQLKKWHEKNLSSHPDEVEELYREAEKDILKANEEFVRLLKADVKLNQTDSTGDQRVLGEE